MLARGNPLETSLCAKHSCPLFQYSRSVALEFAVLLTVICYVSSFALHDVKRLLARPPHAAHNPNDPGGTWTARSAASTGVDWSTEPLQPPVLLSRKALEAQSISGVDVP